MRKALPLLLVALLALLSPFNAQATTAAQVHAVMFWSDGCPYCKSTLTDFLPGIQQQYGSQLEITLVELVTLEDIDKFYALAASYGLMKSQASVPLMLVGSDILIGADQVAAEMPALVEQYLAAGGVDYPASALLDELLPTGQLFTDFDPARITNTAAVAAAETKSNGMALAWTTMIGMFAALLVVGIFVVRAFQGRPLPMPQWVEWAIPFLAIVGLGVALYLTYTGLNEVIPICGPVAGCGDVQQSPYAKLFGILPVGLLGAFGYVAILLAWLYRRFRRDRLAHLAGPALFGMGLFGTLFSIYLTYLEIFVIKAVCIWCISSAILITLLMLAGLPPLTQWLAAADEEEE